MIAPAFGISSSDAAQGAAPNGRRAIAHLGLRDWVSPSGAGSVAFTDVAGYRVAAGLPRVSLADRAADLAAVLREFEASCRHAGRRPLHFGLPGFALEFLDDGLTDDQGSMASRARWHVGDLPVFDLDRWRGASGIPASLPAAIRSQARRARKQGITVRHMPVPPCGSGGPDGAFDSLFVCLRAWLQEKPLPPLRFLTTPFLFEPWPEEGVFVAERKIGNATENKTEVVGFLTASRVLFGDVLRVDVVGRLPGAPNGCSELLVCEAFRHAAERGIARATLGLAPLSRRSVARAPGWPNRISGMVRRFGSTAYSFAGLEAFKAKFEPDAWVPLYCVASGRRFSPGDLLAVARAFAGGSLRRYALQALRWKLSGRPFRKRGRRGETGKPEL